MSDSEKFSMNISRNQTARDYQYLEEMEKYFESSLGTNVDKLRNFAKFVPRPEISRFLAKRALFEEILETHGYIVECGVFLGGGLMSWAQFSSIYEPLNHVRRIVGFDSFQGFSDFHEKDAGSNPSFAVRGGLATRAQHDIQECIRLYDLARPLGHIPRVEVVAGDASETIPAYVKSSPHLVVALLYLDFDLYTPTKVAIECLVPRMPKGAIVAFDELNNKDWPGETSAVFDTIGIRTLRLRRFRFQPQISYAVLE
jgi:hypothetical protein